LLGPVSTWILKEEFLGEEQGDAINKEEMRGKKGKIGGHLSRRQAERRQEGRKAE